MKKLLFLFAFAFCFIVGNAQTWPNFNGAELVSKPQIFQKWISIAPYSVAQLPAASSCPRCEVFVTDSLKIAISNGTTWTYLGSSSGGGGAWGAITGNILSQADLQNQFATVFKYADTSTVFRAYLNNVLRHSDSAALLINYALTSNVVKYSDSTGGGVLTEFVKNINYNPTTIGLGNVLNRKQVINLGGWDSVKVVNFSSFPPAATGATFTYAPDSNAIYYDNGSAYTKIAGGSGGGGSADDSVHMASRYYVQTTFVPLSSYNTAGIETALGFVPYNSTNPNGYINANQVITITPSGDIKGKASGSTAINPVDTVTGLLTKPLPSLAKGILSYNSSAWALGPLSLTDLSYFTGSITVPNGGTGVTSFATNALVFGGITQTGGLQQLAGSAQITYGTAGQALLSAGNNTLPTWGSVYKPSDTLSTLATQAFVLNKSYISGNQTISLNFGGTDVSGSASGATSLSLNPVVTGIRGVTIPTLANGLMRYTTGTGWAFDNNAYVTPVILSDSLQAADTINIIKIGSAGNATVYGQSTNAIYTRLLQNSQANADSSLDLYSSARVVHQTAHGFILGEPLSFSAGAFIAADTLNPALGVVSRVVDANDFEINMGGWMPWSSNGLTAGNYYYVGEPAGSLTTTSPNRSQPVVYAIDANNVIVNVMRPHNFNGGSGVLTSIPPLDSVLAHGNTSGRAMTVGAFSSISASVSGSVTLPGLPDLKTAASQVILVDTPSGNLSRYPAQLINMSISNRNGYVATYDSVNNIFYLGPGGSGGSALTMGALDGQTSSANGASVVGGQLFMQSAGANAGLLTTTGSQTVGGTKIWTGSTQEWTGTIIEYPNLPDWVAANYAHYNVVLQDSTATGKLNIAPAEYINMNGASNGWIPFWNSAASQFQLEQIPVQSVNGGNFTPLFTTSLTAGVNPALVFTAIAFSPWTIYGNNTASSANAITFTPSLTNGLFASEGTTTTLLHGNASGNLSFSAVNLGSDVTSTLTTTHGGTGFAGYTLGDMMTGGTLNTLTIITGNTTTNREFLTQVGTGAASAAPTWGVLQSADVTNALTFTPENVANKASTVSASTTQYPTNTAVINYVTANAFPKIGGTATATNGTGFFGMLNQSATPTTPGSGELMYTAANNTVSYLGPNSFVSTFSFGAAANRTYTFPDITDVITTNTAVQTLSNKTLTSPNFVFGSDQAGDIPVRNGSTYTNLAAGSVTGQVLQIVGGNTPGYGQVLLSGNYSPGLIAVSNVSSSSVQNAWWMRNGQFVEVTIILSVNPTSANTETQIEAAVPVAYGVGQPSQQVGIGTSNSGGGSYVTGNINTVGLISGTQYVLFDYKPTTTGSANVVLKFSYPL